MNNVLTVYIDCRSDKGDTNDFYTLSMWGKPCFEYVCDTVSETDIFAEKYLLTNSDKIKKLASKYDFKVTSQLPEDKSPKMLISGKAIFLTRETLVDAVSAYVGGHFLPIVGKVTTGVDFLEPSFNKSSQVEVVPAFLIGDGTERISYFDLPQSEALVINSVNDFELALILMKKKLGRSLLTESILSRIQEKKDIFTQCDDENTICLVGHSQLDNWNCTEIAGKKVRNCGIRGISSVEYKQYILDRELLNCKANTYIVMHGTNDIVYPYTDEFIVDSIAQTFDYITQRNPKAKIYFLLISNTNGRLDRSNKRIDQLNKRLISAFSQQVTIIDTKPLSDMFGDLRSEYTLDGLHFSDEGYTHLKAIVEEAIK